MFSPWSIPCARYARGWMNGAEKYLMEFHNWTDKIHLINMLFIASSIHLNFYPIWLRINEVFSFHSLTMYYLNIIQENVYQSIIKMNKKIRSILHPRRKQTCKIFFYGYENKWRENVINIWVNILSVIPLKVRNYIGNVILSWSCYSSALDCLNLSR